MVNRDKEILETLRHPYARTFFYDQESDTYTALILEFPGCIAQGNTLVEAAENLDHSAYAWVAATIGRGKVPPPQMAIGREVLYEALTMHSYRCGWLDGSDSIVYPEGDPWLVDKLGEVDKSSVRREFTRRVDHIKRGKQ